MTNAETSTRELTLKQTRFAKEYLVDLNATQAAIRAGYSPRSAGEQAVALLKHPSIAAAIDAGKLARSERLDVDADWMLRRLVDEAEADLADLYDVETGDLKPVEEWPTIWRQGLVAGLEIEALFEGLGEDRKQIGHVKKIKLSDRIRRLELIGKHVRVNAFQENVKLTGLDGLGDRVARAKLRQANAGPREIELTPSPSLLPSSASPAPVEPERSAPVERVQVAEPRDTPPAPAKTSPYRPLLPPAEPAWPFSGGNVVIEYDPLNMKDKP